MRGRVLALAVLLVASASFVGCNQEQQPTPTATEQATPQPTPTETSQPTEVLPSATATEEASEQLQPFEKYQTGKRVSDLGIIISSERGLVDEGEPVRLRFTVINRGDEKQVIEVEDKPVMDIMVTYEKNGDNVPVYWSDGREVTADMRRLELGPGESKTIEMTWIAEGPRFSGPDIRGILNDEHRAYKTHFSICIGSCGDGF